MRKPMTIFTKNATDSDGVNGDYILVFHHNSSKGDLFKSEKDFLYANTEMKYSLFGFIDDSFKFDGQNFEFLIEYPNDNTHGFWLQNTNPWKTEPDSNIGYVDKGKNFKGNIEFTGLTRQKYKSTYIDGCSFGLEKWFYSIGSRAFWGSGLTIPGSYEGYNPSINEVLLWMRISSLKFLRTKLFGFITCATKKQILFHQFIFISLLLS